MKYEVGIIIITARGSIGKCIITAVPMAMNQSCYALRAKKENRVPYLYFITKQLIEHLKVKGAGSVFKSIIASDIKSSNLAIGNDSVVDSFCCMTSPMFEAIKNNTIEIDNLTAQRDSLLPLLMNGQVTIKD